MLKRLALFLLFFLLISLVQRATLEAQSGRSQSELYRVSRAARSAETDGKIERALDLWYAVDKIKPGYFSAYSGIKRNLLTLGRYDEALTFLDLSLEKARSGKISLDPVTISADRIEVFYARGDSIAARNEMQNVLESFQGNSKIYKELSNVLASQRMSDEAIALLIRGREECDDPYLYARELGGWYEARMDWKAAAREYLLYLKESPHRLSYITGTIGDLTEEQGADSLVVDVVEEAIDDSEGEFQQLQRRLLASLHFRKRRFDKALEQYQILERESENQGKELLEFAQLTMSEGEYNLAQKAFRQVLSGNPSVNLQSAVLLGIGLCHEKLNQPDSAEVVYKQIIQTGEPASALYDAMVRLGFIEFNTHQNPEKARNYFENAVDVSRSARKPLTEVKLIKVAIAQTFIKENNLKEGEKQLKRIARYQRRPDDAESAAQFELARLYYRQGEIEDFVKTSNELLAASPSVDQANDILEIKALASDLKEHKDLLEKFGKADLALFQNKADHARDIWIDIATSGNSKATEAALWKLYDLTRDRNDYDAAAGYLNSILELKSSVRKDLALLSLGILNVNHLNDPQQALNYYEQLLIDFPNSPLADEARSRMQRISQEL